MDISPLPHKVPFSFSNALKVQPPTPEPTLDDDMISPCEPVPNAHLELPDNNGRPLEYVFMPTSTVSLANLFPDASDPPFSDPRFPAPSALPQPTSYSFQRQLTTSYQRSPLALVVTA
jgi:hypothetical protein